MTMAAAASKQGIILGRLWKALLLSRSKRLKENKKLMKRPTGQNSTRKRKKKVVFFCPPIFFALLTSGNLIRWGSDRPFGFLFRCHGTLIVPYEMIDHIMSTPGEFATYDLLQPDVVSSPILIPRLHLLRLLPPGLLFPCPRSPGQVGTTVKSEV